MNAIAGAIPRSEESARNRATRTYSTLLWKYSTAELRNEDMPKADTDKFAHAVDVLGLSAEQVERDADLVARLLDVQGDHEALEGRVKDGPQVAEIESELEALDARLVKELDKQLEPRREVLGRLQTARDDADTLRGFEELTATLTAQLTPAARGGE